MSEQEKCHVAIVGSRDYPKLKDVVDYVDTLPSHWIVISGGARGVDKVAEGAAEARGITTMIFPAEWNKYGQSAGYRRNEDIVKAADSLVAFWDGKSRGTKHSITLAEKKGIPVTIVKP